MHSIELFLVSLAIYLSIGIMFSFGFVARGARRIDPVISSASIGVKLLIFPGGALIWPVLLLKWIRA